MPNLTERPKLPRRGSRPAAWLIVGALALLSACAPTRPALWPTSGPVSGPISHTARPVAASTAHPLATQAALQMLAEGGSAVDATVAAQMVLGLVEPQSSGLGGGALMLVWDSDSRKLLSYDGLAAAPARTTASLRTDVDGRPLSAAQVDRGGRSVGVPGALAAMELAHRKHGRLPWSRLFAPALALATRGYPMAPYVHGILVRDPGAHLHPDFRDLLFDAQGQARAIGTILRNPVYAATLRQVAALGVDGFWRSGAADRLVAAAQRGPLPSLMTVDDVLAYRAAERAPVCAAVRVWTVCTAGPPSFGGITVLQMLQMIDARVGDGITPAALDDAAFWHVYAEAGRLAQADRRHWVGDPDHVAVPVSTLVAAPYLRQRAAGIDLQRAAASVRHGSPVPPPVSLQTDLDPITTADQTSQIVVVDGDGTVATTTTTINLNFGSRLRVDGYVLNNALTNFTAAPAPGQTLANQMAPGKRAITSMAPLIVFDASGRPLLAGGSAGGGQIVDYITRSLIEMLWLDRSPAQALAGGHLTTALAPRIQLEAGTARANLAEALRARGHTVVVEPTLSGAGFLKRAPGGWIGAADPRRDGLALGR
jgi:gamma-glutamyltranspeptidase / glutathione hydrolase